MSRRVIRICNWTKCWILGEPITLRGSSLDLMDSDSTLEDATGLTDAEFDLFKKLNFKMKASLPTRNTLLQLVTGE